MPDHRNGLTHDLKREHATRSVARVRRTTLRHDAGGADGREMAIGLPRAHPSWKTLPRKQQHATLDPDFRLKLLERFLA